MTVIPYTHAGSPQAGWVNQVSFHANGKSSLPQTREGSAIVENRKKASEHSSGLIELRYLNAQSDERSFFLEAEPATRKSKDINI